MQNSITQIDINALYELSLSFGQTLDFHQNCLGFSETLKKILKQSSFSLWQVSKQDETVFECVFLNGKLILKKETQNSASGIFKFLKTKNHLSFCADDVLFIKNAKQFQIKRGCISFLKTSDSQVILLHSNKSESILSDELAVQLQPLLVSFGITLNASKKEEQLFEEKSNNEELFEELRQFQMMVENISSLQRRNMTLFPVIRPIRF